MLVFKRLPVLVWLWASTVFVALGQPAEQFVKVSVTPDRPDWQYRNGEKVRFLVSVTQSGAPVSGAEVRYEVMPEKMKPVQSGALKLDNGRATIEGGTLKTAGFLRCEVYVQAGGKEYNGLATAAFQPGDIGPVATLPDDFLDFWNGAKAKLAKVPLDARMTLLPDRCTEKVNVYHVNIRNYKNSRLYGILCVPKKQGRYPALLQVPGAGIRPYGGDVARAEKGVITLQVGIHGIPVTMEKEVYDDLAAGPLAGYPGFNLDSRDHYYYKRVYLGCVRAVDFLVNLPQCDPARLAVTGGSQGGALSVVTAALDVRVKYLAAYYPALCDLTGYLQGRAGGWPHLFAESGKGSNRKPEKIETALYYDVVNFARQVKIPGFYSWGYNDEVCPPTSMHAAYNVISAPKELFIVPETGHWTYPEQIERGDAWLFAKLGEGGQK